MKKCYLKKCDDLMHFYWKTLLSLDYKKYRLFCTKNCMWVFKKKATSHACRKIISWDGSVSNDFSFKNKCMNLVIIHVESYSDIDGIIESINVNTNSIKKWLFKNLIILLSKNWIRQNYLHLKQRIFTSLQFTFNNFQFYNHSIDIMEPVINVIEFQQQSINKLIKSVIWKMSLILRLLINSLINLCEKQIWHFDKWARWKNWTKNWIE